MQFKPIKVITVILGMSLTAYAADSDYWSDFERENRRTGISLINHIQNLSIVSDDAPSHVKNHDFVRIIRT